MAIASHNNEAGKVNREEILTSQTKVSLEAMNEHTSQALVSKSRL